MRRRDHEHIVGELRRENQYLRDQNRDLLDRLMYVLGNESPWTPQPAVEGEPEEQPDFMWAPEQTLDAVEVD